MDKGRKEWCDNMQLLPGERKMEQRFGEQEREGEEKTKIDLVKRKDVLGKCSYRNSFPFDTAGSSPFY